MPRYLQPKAANQPATSKRYLTPGGQSAPAAPVAAAEDDSLITPWLEGAAGVAAGAGLYALTKNPQAAMNAAKTAGGALLDLRRASMLSGLAPLKSFLGNVGGSAYESIERGSIAPFREMMSPTTAREAWETFKAGPSYEMAGPANLETGLSKIPGIKYLHPGRVMGALDTASQSALKRAGLSEPDAARAMLQAPLPKGLAKSLDNPVMNYLVPFRRTPFNQLIEGGKTFAADTTGKKVALGTALASGAATGALAEDPKSIGLGTALSGRYGLPFTLAAGIGRAVASGSKATGAEAIQGASPLSDYSLAEGAIGPVMDPTSLVPKPAAISAVDYLRKLLGME